jgi:hypothetical protein
MHPLTTIDLPAFFAEMPLLGGFILQLLVGYSWFYFFHQCSDCYWLTQHSTNLIYHNLINTTDEQSYQKM